jgi:hypothetical protein
MWKKISTANKGLSPPQGTEHRVPTPPRSTGSKEGIAKPYQIYKDMQRSCADVNSPIDKSAELSQGAL